MSRKGDLIARCKILVETVTNAESAMGEAIQKIHEDGVSQLEQDKKIFRAGFEERKSRVC